MLQVAIASYALFSSNRGSAGEIAAALAVVLLPFSLLGPFAGVMLDRWSRRQVLFWANLARVVLLAGLAAVVAADLPTWCFYGVVLVSLSLNRFLLAGLSAALPHTVEPDDLLTANALTPTAGTGAFLLGLGVGGAVRAAVGAGDPPVLVVGAVLYAGAAVLALRIPRGLLGPDRDDAPTPLSSALVDVATGLVHGLRHLRTRRVAARGLVLVAAQRFLFGLTTLMTVLLVRGHFHDASESAAALADLGLVTLVGGVGFLAAAVATPAATERMAPHRWMVLLLALAGLGTALPALSLGLGTVLAAAAVTGLAAQGVKICVDTFVQRDVADRYRGRVFSIYDVLFNVAFVAAAATGAAVLPPDGRSAVLLWLVAGAYVALAAAYLRLGRPQAATASMAERS